MTNTDIRLIAICCQCCSAGFRCLSSNAMLILCLCAASLKQIQQNLTFVLFCHRLADTPHVLMHILLDAHYHFALCSDTWLDADVCRYDHKFSAEPYATQTTQQLVSTARHHVSRYFKRRRQLSKLVATVARIKHEKYGKLPTCQTNSHQREIPSQR